jgi:hypothetical protein
MSEGKPIQKKQKESSCNGECVLEARGISDSKAA